MNLVKSGKINPLAVAFGSMLFVFLTLFIIVPAGISAADVNTITVDYTSALAMNDADEAEDPESEPEVFDMEQSVEDLKQQDDEALYLLRQPRTRASVEWFYIGVTGNREVSLAILEAAEENNIPLSLAFSLAYAESRYKPTAKNVNKNGSVDRGLFQLNSGTFPNLTESQFYDPKVSAHKGLEHLRYCLDTAGNEIAAMAMYNAGTNKVHDNRTPKVTLDYISQIESYRSALDQSFETEVLSLYVNPDDSESKLALFR
ncbi:MAG: transglycosylase SLT domain-containing protein [Treponema sp.]|nr:transglycosylase SLT domain-containing protein [Treponema sp.]